MKKKLFRKEPPREFVEEIVRSCGLSGGLEDLRWFSTDELKLEGAEDWLALLEPYYLPCKAQRFFYDREGAFDGRAAVTILRHVLDCHGYQLKVQERLYKDKKQSLYQIQPVRSFKDLSGMDLIVTFT